MAQPITVEFLKKNFADYGENNNVYSTTREQSPRCVDVFMFRAENAKLKERINEMVENRREYLDV